MLRGFSLLGIWLVHFLLPYAVQNTAGHVHAHSTGKLAVGLGVEMLMVGKFFSIFSLLFGLGFSLQLRSASAKGHPFVGRYIWRLVLLGAIGGLHRLIFESDILHLYAVVGLLLVLVRRWGNAWLLFTSASLFMGGLCFSFCVAPATALFIRVAGEPTGRFLMDEILVYRLFTVAAMFVLGLYLGRKNVFSDGPANRVFFKRVLFAAAGLFVGLKLGYYLLGLGGGGQAHPYDGAYFALKNISLSALYVAGIVQLYQRPLLRKKMAWLGPIGQMGMSVYVLQSLCMVFFAWAIERYVEVAAPQLAWVLGAAALLFAGQAVAARWWMQRFRYGPLEWAWRSLTYLKRQPLRRVRARVYYLRKDFVPVRTFALRTVPLQARRRAGTGAKQA